MFRFTLPLAVVLAVASSQCLGDDLTPSQAAFKPTPVPDRVLLSWKGDPATTQSVAWRTDDSVTDAVAEIAIAEPGPAFEKHARTVAAVSRPLETNLGNARYHSVTFEELKPNTLYAYRVGDGKTWSEWFQFRTASDNSAPLRFIYVGDAQTNLKSHWSRVVRQAYSDAPKATFLLHAGDLVNRGDADQEWGEWFYALGWMSGSVPSIAVPGNHEYSSLNKKVKRGLTAHWRPQFELPENGPMGLEESVFYVDVQGLRIVGLNSNEDPEIQAAWLEEILKNNPNRWTIVTHHHPIHSTSRGRDNEHLRRTWQPLYDRYTVDLVLQGHDHSYGRSGPLAFDPSEQNVSAKGEAPDSSDGNLATGARGRTPGGTVYVVSVSGPKMYELKEYEKGRNPFRRSAADTQLYQIISIDGDELRYEARTATGSLYDAFTLTKREGKPSAFAEQVPQTVEERLGDRESSVD